MGNSLVIREVKNRDEWNALVLSLPKYDLRQGYEWGEARVSQGWSPRRIAVFEGQSCVAAIAILEKRIPLLGRSILYAPGGPLLKDTRHDRAWDRLLAGIRQVATETDAIFLRVSPKNSNEDLSIRNVLVARGFHNLAEDWTTWNTPRITMTSNLEGSEDFLYQKLRKRFREYIASAPRRGVSIRKAVSVKQARDFRDALAFVGRGKRFPVRGKSYFERLWEEYVTREEGVLFLTEHDGQVVGGLLGAKLGDRAYMLYVTVRERNGAPKLQQGPFLYWEFIRWAKREGCKKIDWGGVGTNFPPREDDPGFGIYRFKEGFNASLTYLTGYHDLVFSNPSYRAFRLLERWASAFAWIVRAKLNGRFSRPKALVRTDSIQARNGQAAAPAPNIESVRQGFRGAVPKSDLNGVRVIVTDADTRLGLYVIRALGRAGCRVTALSTPCESKKIIGFASRFANERHLLLAGGHPQALLGSLETLANRHDVLIPISPLSISLVAEHAAQLQSSIRFYIPPIDAFRNATDKVATTRIAREAGIPAPATYHGLDPLKIEQWAMDTSVRFPLVVKFANDVRSDLWNPGDRYRIVRSASDLAREYRRMCEVGGHAMVQEYVDGDGYGFFAITKASGEPLVTFCHRRLREYPISGGPSTLCESIYDKTLVELGTQLLRIMRWRGVAMVEFRRDYRQKVYKFLEINPRFWGSLPLAIQCGVNFPVYQVQMALGVEPKLNHDYPVGRKMRFLFSDLCAVREQLRDGRKMGVMLEYIKELSDFSIKDGLFEKDDPRPAMRYVLSKLGR